MVLLRKAKPLLVALPLALGGVQLAGGVEQQADYSVTATKYDTRPYEASNEFAGCSTDGCSPDLMNDGNLNDVPDSRWSCETALEGTEFECYATFDLGSSQSLTKLTIYFYKSNEEDRVTNPFVVSTSTDGTTFTTSFEDINTIPTPLGEGEDFAFPTGSSGRYVRFTGDLADDQWLSINEVEIYVDVATPAPVVPETPAPIPPPTPVPTVEVTVNAPTPSPVAVATLSPVAVATVAPSAVSRDITMAPAAAIIAPTGVPAPVAAPTPGPTPIGGPACGNVTVSNAGDLNGDYASSLNGDGSVTYVSTGAIAATIASSNAPAQCADSTASDCTVNRWQITPSDADSTLPTYVVYDEALHPSTINEVWLRLDNCGSSGCQSSPAELTILCGDGTTAAGSGTPAPASVTASDCEAIEVAGTLGAESDGFYYDDGSELGDGVTQYVGYDVVNGELTSNGRAVVANRVDSTCATTTTSTGADACSWRQWWIEPSSSGTVSYFTYDEAGHPVDIAAGTLWYTSDDTVVPYDGDVVVTCAPATTPTLTPATSPAPTPTATSTDRGTDDGTATRMPVEGTHAPGTAAPVVAGGEDGDGDGGGGSDTVVIAAGVAGGVALLAILGAVAYKLKKNPPPPPSYDDLVGA